MKIELLKKFNITLSTDEIKIIINSELDIDEKTKLLNDFININKTTTINNGTINNGTMNNNTTNNIQINNFGKENLEHLDNEYFKDLIMNNHIQTAYMKLIEDTYLDEKHPENQTIKIDNINNKYGFVFENGKWRAILKYELKELMHEKNNKLLKIHYKRLREFLNAAKRSSINVFFSRGYDSDPHLKLMNDQMILLFYEGKPKNVI
jgi:coenzyme F420-reducing hydrogenase alpha subunit